MKTCSKYCRSSRRGRIFLIGFLFFTVIAYSQNPLIMDQFTADPTARVFDGKLWLYPSHDIPCEEGQGFVGFCMPDYHAFSSENLTDWEDHGIILSQYNVPWVDSTSYTMWAPDCIYKNGKYYYYFPATALYKGNDEGRSVGVAVSDKPNGPFIPEKKPMKVVSGIDPNVFIDSDGQAYLYWYGRGKDRIIYAAKLKENMLELATDPVSIKIDGIDETKFKEGPFVFEREGIYYFTFPYIPETIEQIVYACGNSPLGPFEYKGIIMKESPTKCYTNHQSIVEYKGQHYLFYHHNDLSPTSDKRRSVKADSLFFNEDGTIQEVIPSWRGIGVSSAKNEIHIDRYSAHSSEGASVMFIDENDTFQGWLTKLDSPGAWIRYNSVEFCEKKLRKVLLKLRTDLGGSIEVRLNAPDGLLVSSIDLKESANWQTIGAKSKRIQAGIYDLFIVSKSENPVEIDWVKFE